MKYIKLYEYINQYYQEITYNDFSEMIGGITLDNVITFTNEEIYRIGELDDVSIYPNNRKTPRLSLYKSDVGCIIYKLSDEWYVIQTNDPKKPGYFYNKCDQMEGLIKRLQDI